MLPIGQQSSTIRYEHFTSASRYRNNQSVISPSGTIKKRKNKSKIIPKQNQLNPCNGSYIKTNGTTCGLKEIMIGRCNEYQYLKRGLYLTNTTEVKDCLKLYKLFESAARNKSYCNMNMSTYEDYFNYALEGIHVINRAIFWGGTYALTHDYSNRGLHYITLEDTLAAAMADGLSWCGKENDTEGFDYVSCPRNCQDNIWADDAFWGLASKTFAQKVTGEIYYILNGSRTDCQPSYRNNSYFAKYELPNLRTTGPNRVTKMNVLLLHSPDQKVIERCGEKSLIILEKIVRNYSIEYECKDDPEQLILMMCSDQWEARECFMARQILRQQWNLKVFGKSNAISHSISFVFLFFIIINYFL
ncbi:unnamed protein product [Rotaria sp. Silwood1]|nr:unnamed protein product [Rotaria sp. Silwood1]CAF1573802.1 unnamed protein product [Rotaria sp. Silwood1]CAF3643476.1 unnamed protein product [Rotaria sp. Silwood1]CAF3678374.1 unnamed protein product [Rotaria sp. Silwood1]CAF4937646.1 unnamed protein product [Rotaria sp. Silwood1]